MTTTTTTLFSPPAHHVERALHSLPVSLLEAVASANENAVLRALQDGADINASDPNGRTVVGYVIGGDIWEDVDASDASYMLPKRLRILRTLLGHPEISLHTLNAPQAALRGVTPLGLAAWLNVPEIVRLILECCPGLVSVDGMDSLGATPLMYAARDGSIEVVEQLVSHGARPDYRDISHRTSIQHALRHPQALWLCESALRIHRAQEQIAEPHKRSLTDLPTLDEHFVSMPHPSCPPQLLHPSQQQLYDITDSLIHAISCTDVQQLYHLLFSPLSSSSQPHSLPPTLVNHPDSRGWSPIHHCVSASSPSKTMLDILYRAGADMSLYTTSGHGTPLHCLAHKAPASTPATIQPFIRHLVFDLRAPLAARDQNKDTCIHIAAERGDSYEVLAALLACDPTGVVREMRNSRGLNALEVAKPEFRAAFGTAEQDRCGSSASIRTVKPSTTSTRSESSLASLVAANLRRQHMAERSGHSVDCSEETQPEISTLALRILDNLRQTSQGLEGDEELVDVHLIESILRATSEMSEELVVHLQSRVNEVTDDLQGARAKFEVVDGLLDEVTRLVEDTYGERFEELERAWDSPDSIRRRTTDSGDSGSTAVSSVTSELGLMTSKDQVEKEKVDVAVSTCPESVLVESPPVTVHTASSLHFSEVQNIAAVSPSVTEYQLSRLAPIAEEKGLMKIMSPWIVPPRKKSKTNLKAKSYDDLRVTSSLSLVGDSDRKDTLSSRSKFKAWFKKKIMPDAPPARLLIVEDVDELACAVGREVKRPTPAPDPPVPKLSTGTPESRNAALTAARKIIATSSKDLSRIDQCITSADKYISRANRSIAQAEQTLTRCIAQRETALDRVSLIQQMNEMQHALHDIVLSSSTGSEDIPFPEASDFLPITIPTSTRNSQLVFPRPPLSSKSSVVSLTSTLNEGDDGDLRALRRLITRKIDERTEAAGEEIEKAMDWLRVVKDIVQGLRKRT
ncbi:unnamed protein product [Somion occarium]|uniref:Ankyrin n=1 Tax=Somion occarium TaxID=3059160 RepID=A0ABP1E8R4_9APHY